MGVVGVLLGGCFPPSHNIVRVPRRVKKKTTSHLLKYNQDGVLSRHFKGNHLLSILEIIPLLSVSQFFLALFSLLIFVFSPPALLSSSHCPCQSKHILYLK